MTEVVVEVEREEEILTVVVMMDKVQILTEEAKVQMMGMEEAKVQMVGMEEVKVRMDNKVVQKK